MGVGRGGLAVEMSAGKGYKRRPKGFGTVTLPRDVCISNFDHTVTASGKQLRDARYRSASGLEGYQLGFQFVVRPSWALNLIKISEFQGCCFVGKAKGRINEAPGVARRTPNTAAGGGIWCLKMVGRNPARCNSCRETRRCMSDVEKEWRATTHSGGPRR
jgi:hypothetical protein